MLSDSLGELSVGNNKLFYKNKLKNFISTY